MLQTAEDIKNLELDKPGRGKSLEQIKKHTVPESFSNRPIDRALQLLTKGDEVQRVSVVQSLPELFRYDANATCTRIIPKVQQELQNSSCEFNVASCKSFKFIIEKRLPVNIIPNVLQGLEAKDPIVVNVWLEMLVDVLTLLPEEIVKKEIMPMALSKSNISQPISARIVSCAILGKLAIYPKFVQKDIKNIILPAIQGLCQDCSPDVRSAICAQIPNVCQGDKIKKQFLHMKTILTPLVGLGTDLNRSTIISSLVELASDNSPPVRSSAVITIVTIVPLLDQNVKKNIMLPLVKQLCEKSQTRDDVTGAVVTKQIGRLINGLLPIMTLEDIVWFLYCFKKLAHRGLTTKPGELKGDPALDMVCRDNCAYNLPAIANLIGTKAKEEMEVVYTIFRDLTADPCYIVRKSVAASIHEIIKVLGVNSKVIRADVVRLLRDDAEEVLLSLVPNLGTILSLLSQYGILTKDKADQTTVEIGRALLKCQLELTKGYNWRLLTTLLLQQEFLPKCMPADFIHQHFAPVVLSNVINGRARPVREQGASTLLIFLKNNAKEAHQKWIRDSLITNLCYSNSSYTRIIYVKMCRHALELFSTQYFREHFLLPLMTLIDDPISNIRYCVVCLLPLLKQLALNDFKCKQILSDAVAKLESKETDKDVLNKLKSKAKELDEFKTGFTRSSATTKVSSYQVNQAIPVTQQAKPVKPANQQMQSSQSNTSKKVIQPSKPVQSAPSNKTVQQANVVRRTGPPMSSDRNFLEQHFYVDAGINIPLTHNDTDNVQLLNSKIPLVVSETEIRGLSTIEIDKLKNSTTNITDDVKVNLRKLNEQSSKLQQPKNYNKVHKRHSTIITTPNIDISSKKAQNRRSLNIQTKDLSKIPIFSSKSIKIETNRDLSNKENKKTDKNDQISDSLTGVNDDIVTKNNGGSLERSAQIKNDGDNAKENLVPTKSNNFKSKLPSNLPLASKKTAFGPT